MKSNVFAAAHIVLSLIILEALALGLSVIIGLFVDVNVPYLPIGLIVVGVWILVIILPHWH